MMTYAYLMMKSLKLLSVL